ncbi:response regulator [Ectothiorhodospira lacustris]|uniref:response regulator n=1 Tax=Ectothiorhodospira lacustris TaxID=2899127 RepID=UPI001EE7EE7D|nr:response regulator [Ectothiorhodospira lacustris]MCG5502161.1 response regulator [Ectothiorhodospira lacustris]MCG5510820.1 response regulator [Ectothiorhodospira lacustris]MCG5522552.1 response regulator [Ectothiorhodospira lacustris]
MSARILIAEDHPASLELMSYLLRAHGYDILPAENGEIALALAHSERPDLILCDLQMPAKTGFEVAEAVKSDPRTKDIPLIAVTAFSMLGDREKVLAAGFDDYFSKPIDATCFVRDLEQHLPPSLLATRLPRATRNGT